MTSALIVVDMLNTYEHEAAVYTFPRVVALPRVLVGQRPHHLALRVRTPAA